MIRLPLRSAILFFLLAGYGCRTTPEALQSQVLDRSDQSSYLSQYEHMRIRGLQAEIPFDQFRPEQGIFVTERNQDGTARLATIRVLSDNASNEIYFISEHNGWGERKTDADLLQAVAGTPYFEGTITKPQHLMQYRLLLNGQQVIDPAASMFTSPEFFDRFQIESPVYLNSVFWDFDRPGSYKMRTQSVDLREKPLLIAETEVYELIRKWECNGRRGPSQVYFTYKFIAECGVLDRLREMGYNGVEFLPFNQSVDGEKWQFRYQVFGLFAPDSRYGTPDEFAMMMDEFNEEGLAVIMDAVVGHYPYKANLSPRELEPVGIHNWKKTDGNSLYGSVGSPWGTYRYDYANPYIRRFLTDSILHMVGKYGISGIRFDNLDGIRLYEGPGGGGPDFLRMLVKELRAYRPEMLLIGEMFFGHSPVLARTDANGFGINFRTHSEFFDFLKDNMLLSTEAVNMEMLRGAIRNPWDWNEAARVQYATNHDEAANRRNGATGEYLASLIGGSDWFYVERKSIAFPSLAMLSSTAYLDMPQLRLLQQGSFTSNPSVEWDLLQHESQAKVFRYFSDLSNLFIGHEAFSFQNAHPNIENHTDYANKLISLYRFGGGEDFYVLINLGHKTFENYQVGVNQVGNFRIALDSDAKVYGGGGELERRAASGVLTAADAESHGKSHSVFVPWVGPYSVTVLQRER